MGGKEEEAANRGRTAAAADPVGLDSMELPMVIHHDVFNTWARSKSAA